MIAHVKDKNTGEEYTKITTTVHPTGVPWNPKTEALVGVSARPNALTAGGAYFGLANALGGAQNLDVGQRRVAMAEGINRLDNGALSTFGDEWYAQPSERYSGTEPTFSRIATGSKFVGEFAPAGGKVQHATRVAQFVGERGPEAERVFGPTARKTAYRYRGASKIPEAELRSDYSRAVRSAKLATLEDVPPSQMAVRRLAADRRAPSSMEREQGRKAVYGYLRESSPSKQLYGLQLASGNTPPSEGVLRINRDGDIVDQAVGYGDDHYVPFNLKNLKNLRGGEYIRTRSVGGPTTEDIYVGLMSGADRATVVSRSGTFTVAFEPDFKGKRRHNDKAMRMTRRYAQILDAVQSEQVDRAWCPDQIKQIITEDVERKFGGEDRATKREMIKRRITDYKEDPELSS